MAVGVGGGGQDVDLKQAAWELEVLGDGLIQCMILGPEEAAAREAFGVWGQCAFLVRPDGYVAFRSQPISRSAISGFLTQRMGFKPIMDAAVPSWDGDLGGHAPQDGQHPQDLQRPHGHHFAVAGGQPGGDVLCLA